MKKIFISAILLLCISTVFGQIKRTAPKDDELIDISIGNVTSTSITAKFTPKENCSKYYTFIDTINGAEHWIGSVFPGGALNTLEDVIVQFGQIPYTEPITTVFDHDIIPNKDYVVYVCAFDDNNIRQPAISDTTHTTATGGPGISVIDLNVSEITHSSVRLSATPNDQTSKYRDGLIETELFNTIGVDSAARLIWVYNELHTLYEDDDFVWENLNSNTEYKAIAIGQNVNNEFGEIAVIDFATAEDNTFVKNIDNNSINIYPQPNKGFFTIDNIDLSENNEIFIYDISGKCIYQEIMKTNKQTIDISHLSEGVYFLKTKNSEKATKIIIKK